jgi:subtilisin family serine protease
MRALELTNLTPLMNITGGREEIRIGLIDGPVAVNHTDLAQANVRQVEGSLSGSCALSDSSACLHGTLVAGVLCARRGSPAPAICPDCTLLVRPVFAETAAGVEQMPSARPEELAVAIVDCVAAGARLLNLSVGLAQVSLTGQHELEEALNHAARLGVLVVAAAGNQGAVGGTAITRHPWVIPVVACDGQGHPTRQSNLGEGIGRRGLRAPGEDIRSLGAGGPPLTFGGTSAAAPFVTGAMALLWSAFPEASPSEVKLAVTQAASSRRATVVPPLLNAWAAYQSMRRNRP